MQPGDRLDDDVQIQVVFSKQIGNANEANNSLELASITGNKEAIELLVNANVDVRLFNNSALRHAAKDSGKEVIQLLLDANADVHAKYEEALRKAAEFNENKEDVVEMLIEANADIGKAIEKSYHKKKVFDFLMKKFKRHIF